MYTLPIFVHDVDKHEAHPKINNTQPEGRGPVPHSSKLSKKMCPEHI